MRKVVFGFIGNKLDFKGKQQRWSRWRPSVGICLQAEYPIDRLELLYHPSDYQLANQIMLDIQHVSPNTQVNLIAFAVEDMWNFEQVYMQLLDLAKRYPFDLRHEEYSLHITTGTHVIQICWFLLAEARFFPATLLQSSPQLKANDTTPLPLKLTQKNSDLAKIAGNISFIDLNLRRYDQIMTRFQQQALQASAFLKSGINTRNRVFNQLIDEIEYIAVRSTAPILLEGPTGTGKSFLARRIYELKKQQHQMRGHFVEINCSTLRGDNAISTLFGHVKGAFTGAEKNRDGLLKTAHQGILFLDEIAELGADEQAMLLKAIEEKTFYPFGSDHQISSDFQLIAGTHKNLKQCVAKGTFREDLYARINLWHYRLPGLAQRKEDIEPNLDYELAKYAKEYGQLLRFSHEAKSTYLHFATSPQALWSGNFRELNASIVRMATLSAQGNISLAIVNHEIERLQQQWQEEDPPSAISPSLSPAFPQLADLDRFDACQLQHVIEVCQCSSSLSDAGRTLFAISRQQKQTTNDADRLRKYLAKFNLSWEIINNPKSDHKESISL